MRAPWIIALVGLTLGGGSSFAAADSPALVFASESGDGKPTARVLAAEPDRLLVAYQLAKIDMEQVDRDGQTYHALSIDGGGLAGEVGEPGLPTYSKLLAVPSGKGVTVRVVASDEQRFSGYRLAPVEGGETGLRVDATPDADGDQLAAGTVAVGAPALLRGLRVVPVTVRPVSYDAEHGEISVLSSVTVEFTFAGEDRRNDPPAAARPLPESFTRLAADRVVNFSADGSGIDAANAATVTAAEAGAQSTYLAICPANAAVVEALEPLLDWRRRQGYHVILATTADTGPTAISIKNYIWSVYGNTDIPPLEYVVLVGDANGPVAIPCWYENVTYFHGEGDHYYTTLEGDDVLADIMIGRLTCRDTTELGGIVSKIVNYERVPPTTDPSWFGRAALVGDPSDSGITTIFVNQWLQIQLVHHGYTEINTIFSGNYPAQMMTALNRGGTVFGYRGFYGVSGFHSGHIDNLTNGGMLPFAVLPTCESGSFSDDLNARNEAFLRNASGGAIGAIGLATGGTHTRYNNCLYCGIWDGVLNGTNHTLGAAQLSGKLELYANYQMSEPGIVEAWSVWSSLMGDPATDMWINPPLNAEVEFPAQLAVGANAVPVNVTVAGQPLADARVTLYKAGEIHVTGATNAAGQVTLPIADYSAGTLLVTVTQHGLLPHRGSITLGDAALFVSLDQVTIDDDNAGASLGNGDGVVNPGEVVELHCSLRNLGSDLAGAVTAELTSGDPSATIEQGVDSYGDIPPGGVAVGNNGFIVAVSAAAADGQILPLDLQAASGLYSWVSLVELPVVGSALTYTDYNWGGGGTTLDPGENGTLSVALLSDGDLDSPQSMAILRSSSPWITVTDSIGVFESIPSGSSGENVANPFSLAVAPRCFDGHLASFMMIVTHADGTLRNVEFNLPVGTANSSDPVGPDAYGYYAFDDTDTDYLLAAEYDWVEIDPRYGGSGVSVGLEDFGWEQDDTVVLQMPFTFTFYGQAYDRISICSNGWIAMGFTTLKNYRNWTIPSAGSPDRLIAVYWDNLQQSGDNLVYWWHDTELQRLVIQWSNMTSNGGSPQNFQVILYDPLAYPTSTGDGEIVCQYETVHNNDGVNGYATVGIQNTDGTDGLLYTYWNEYAPGAAALAPGRAIRFMPLELTLAATCDVTPTEIAVTLQPDQTEIRTLEIANNGESGSVLHYQLQRVDPEPPTAPPSGGEKDLTGSYATADPTNYDPDTTVDIDFMIHNGSDDDEWIVQVMMDFPTGVVVNSAQAISSTYGPLVFQGSTGDGAVATWSDGVLRPGYNGYTTVNLTFGALTGPVEIPYTLTGDNYGGPPHEISGTIVLENLGPRINVQSPNGGEQWAEVEQRQIEFSADGGPQQVRIELSRDGGENWDLLAAGIDADADTVGWTVTGPVSAHCLVRITDEDDPTVNDTSDAEFTIGHYLAWVEPAQWNGSVAAGGSDDLVLTFDAAGLAIGSYAAELVVLNNTGDPVSVLVTLDVTNGSTPVSAPPERQLLAQNHPNPFNPRTTIRFAVPRAGDVVLVVYDALGRRVRTLVSGQLPAGTHEAVWAGRDDAGRQVAAGMYLYRLETADGVLSRKMALVK